VIDGKPENATSIPIESEKRSLKMNATIVERDGKRFIVVEVEMNKTPESSSTGKTLVLATTHGNQPSNLKFDEQIVTIGVNAYIKAKR
jgi:16S rRNA C1402 (ribose-2'-O) methylase RsmI